MRKNYSLLAFCLVFILSSMQVSAQTSVTITGKVHNSSTKENLPAVSIVVKGTNRGTFTNSDGEFSISVPKLPVTLIFSSINFDNQELDVTSASQKIEINLIPNVTMGQEVVVAASRQQQRLIEAPVTIERLGGAALRNIAAPSYYEALANLKGVDMHTASLTFRTITTRGFMSSGNVRMNQLVDGMNNQAPGLNFSVGNIVGLTEPDVDNIEVLSGASSALYGSGGMNGTVLINSKSPFKYQGLSYNIKQGIMHVDKKQRAIAPYYDWSVRWAKAFNNKIAFKISAELIKGSDWEAQDNDNKQQIGVLSQVVGGNRGNDPNYNGVNVYGDETSVNVGQLAPVIENGINSGVLAATGGTVNLINSANAYFNAIGNPTYPTTAQMNAFISMFPSSLQPTVGFFLPFYNGVKNNYFANAGNVSRTGYQEQDLVDYNSQNFKLNAGFFWKITPGIEASWNTYFGTGTTVYTGADRYSLRNFKIGQHKLEFKAKNWFVRAYTTQENSGESYNASALGGYLNEYWKPSVNNANLSGSWYPQYITVYSEALRQASGNIANINLDALGRSTADIGRLLPGTSAYNNAVNAIRNTPIKKGGALFVDRSDFYSGEGQLNLSDALGFSDKIGMIFGASWKQWVMNSHGTIFADTAGVIKVHEEGAYLQLKKSFLDSVLTLTASGRYDHQGNFGGHFTPRFTAVIRVAKDNDIRFSYQTAYRFPTNQDQDISLVTGAGTLIGCTPEFQSYYKLNSTLPGYTPASILAYRAGGNPANTSILVRGTYNEVKPETVNSFEVGYRGVLSKNLLVDAYYYLSKYQNFLAQYGLGQSQTGNAMEVFSPFTTTNISYIQNSPTPVKSNGWGIGIEYKAYKNYTVYGNVYSDKLRDVPDGYVTYFNAPKYRWNLGLRNDNVCHNVGFNIVVKWQDNNYYQGTFVTGTLPYFTTVDAQVTYRPAKTKSVFRIGGTNLGNNYYRTGYGSPAIGGLYYVSYGYNLF